MKLRTYLEPVFSPGNGAFKIPIAPLIDRHRISYNKLKKKDTAKFNFQVVKVGEVNMVHLKVPSETVPNFCYDVVFELYGLNDAKGIADCDFRAFSNSPSFVYNYAYVYYHLNPDKNDGKMFIRDMRNKVPKASLLTTHTAPLLGEECLKQKPDTKNPLGLPLFDKSLYLALFFMIEKLSIELVQTPSTTMSVKEFLASIVPFEKLMGMREDAVKANTATKKKSNDAFERQIRNKAKLHESKEHARSVSSHKVAQVNSGNVRKTSRSSSGNVRKANKIGRIK